MANYSPEQLLDFWKKGKTLKEAVLFFFDRKYKNQELSNKPNEYSLPGLIDNLNKLAKISLEKNSISHKLKEDLCKKVNKGHLLMIGYESPVKSSDFPVLIPLHVCVPLNMDLNESSISGNGLNFLSVRIVRKSIIKKAGIISAKKEIDLPKYKIEKKKIGRPSIRKYIIEAYNRLDKDGQINPKMSINSHYEPIRSVVKKLAPQFKDDKGMKDEAIRKVISPLFRAKK
jgi:hypothetical protein